MPHTSAGTMTVRVRKRWWARLILFLAPHPISWLHRVSPRAAYAALDGMSSLLGPRALIIEVVNITPTQPASTT